MLSQATRRSSIVVVALLAAAILVALAGSSAHAGHGCLVDQECLACRWAAESVILAPAPPVLSVPEGRALVELQLLPADGSDHSALRRRQRRVSRDSNRWHARRLLQKADTRVGPGARLPGVNGFQDSGARSAETEEN